MSALALCLGFTACDDDENVPAIPVNPAQPTMPADGVTMTPSVQITELLDLKTLNDNSEKISVGTLTLVDFPEDYAPRVDLEISKDADFSTYGIVETEITDNVVYADAETFEAVYLQAISKSPKEKTIYGRVAAYAVNRDDKNDVVRIGGPDVFLNAETMELKVLPYPNDLVIEDAYYLLGTINDWSVADAVKLNHPEGVSGYDDPKFTLAVEITPNQAAEGWWWKVVPASTQATGEWVEADNASYGVAENGDGALTGMLVARTADTDCGAGCIKTPGSYLLTINLEEGTYEFKTAYANLWTPGNANGWNPAGSQMLYTTDDKLYQEYYGYALLDPVGFKFTTAPDWDHVNFGSTGVEGELTTDSSAGNLTCAAAGLYHCTVDVIALTYSLYQVETIGVIGDGTPGGWDASTPLTPSDDLLVWEGDVEFTAGKEWKLRCNDAWDADLGGEETNLVQGGGNMKTPGDGSYHLILDLSTLPYQIYIDKN